MFWFIIPMLLFVYLFAHPLIMGRIRMRYWKKGFVPPFMRDSDENRITLYLALAALLTEPGKVEKHPNLRLLNKLISGHRKARLPLSERNSYFNEMQGSLRYFSAHPVQLASAVRWMSKHQFTRPEKQSVLRLLIAFGMQRGEVGAAATDIIRSLADALGFTEKEIDAMIDARREKEKQEKKKHQTDTRPGEALRCLALLGLDADASTKEIRKAYRSLAHQYHPDKFATASQAQQDAAHQRFLQIRKAYETLENIR